MKRFLSIILSLLILLSSIPTTVYATTTDSNTDIITDDAADENDNIITDDTTDENDNTITDDTTTDGSDVITDSETEDVCAHKTKKVTTKASTKKNGSIKAICTKCNEVVASSTLPKIGNILLSQEVYVYDGKAKKPTVFVLDKEGLVLTKGKDYTVSYASGRKKMGKYKITVKFKGNYTGKKVTYFRIAPASTALTSVKAASKTSVSLTWQKAKKGVTGYQIQCSTSSKFKKGTITTKKIKGYNHASTTVSKLKKNKTYYVRIRTYNTTKKKTTYSDWSDVTKLSLSKSGYSVKKLINKEKLNPQKTNHKQLDKLVSKIFKKIHTKKMSTYDKVKACYDYLVKKMKYGHPEFQWDSYNYSYTSNYDQTIVTNAYEALSSKVGVCDDYSAAFVVMCRRLGLEAYVVGGTVSTKGGGRTGHAWSYILLNGTPYIFDPQVQSNNKHVPYHYFGKTYAQMGSTYERLPGYYNEAMYRDFALSKTNGITCEVTASGRNGSAHHTTTLEYNFSTVNASALYDPIINAHENGCIKFKLNLSGGSGKYEVLLVDAATDAVIYDYIGSKPVTWDINLSLFKEKTKQFYLVVYDYNGDYSSYMIINGIAFGK